MQQLEGVLYLEGGTTVRRSIYSCKQQLEEHLGISVIVHWLPGKT